MEELLNKLIEKGWEPANRVKRGHIYKCEVHGIPGYVNVMFFLKDEEYGNYGMNLRELVAKDTGLWQFVCENGMVKEDILMKSHRRELHTLYETEWYKKYWRVKDYEYRLIESALKDESELEQFLLDNIKIEGKTD